MSDLMQSVLKLLRVHSEVALANCHMKTAIAERKIRTVEQVLKSYVFQHKGRLTDLLPWIAFQMRQSECEVLGYSPHELTFGHNFRDRLTEMRDEFIGEIGKKERKVRKNVLKYLTDLRERIEINRDLATQQAIKSHKRIRAWYNKNANANKTFSTGDKVIILEPDDTRKLFARFSEPKTVEKQLDDRNYLIRLSDDVTKVFHVNQLRKYVERTEYANSVVVACDSEQNPEDSFIKVIEDETQEMPSFNIEPTLNDEERTKIQTVLNEFVDVFRPSLGLTTLAEHSIDLTDDKPVSRPMYRVPESLKKPLAEEIDRLLKAGVLVEGQSDFRSPLIPIKKADNSLRLVNDFKMLNSKTRADLYPMADPNQIIQRAAGKKIISKIDLSKSFLQIGLRKEHQHYTAFSIPSHGTLMWTRMAQGLTGSPATMQRLIDRLIRGCENYASAMLDDFCIYSDSVAEHCQHLRQILSRLREANLTASISKSQFAMAKLEVLGFCLEGGFIKPCQKHVQAISQIQRPRTKSGVRAILGLIGYHRQMIPNAAEIVYPLTAAPACQWEARHDDALAKIKAVLTSDPVLAPPIFDGRPFILMCDASMHAVSGILAQSPRGQANALREISRISRRSCLTDKHDIQF
jgi:hypothetical protein